MATAQLPPMELYADAHAQGLLSDLDLQILDAGLEHGPGFTQFWIKDRLGETDRESGKRFATLERMGVLEVIGTAASPRGNKAKAYSVTGRYPRRPSARY